MIEYTEKEKEYLGRPRPSGLRGLEDFGHDPTTGKCTGAPPNLIEENIIAYWKARENE